MTEQIEQFFRSGGTLISIPVTCDKKLAGLRRIAADFSYDSKYRETQLNEIVVKFHEDTTTIRRYMIEYGILERDSASVYWLSNGF